MQNLYDEIMEKEDFLSHLKYDVKIEISASGEPDNLERRLQLSRGKKVIEVIDLSSETSWKIRVADDKPYKCGIYADVDSGWLETLLVQYKFLKYDEA